MQIVDNYKNNYIKSSDYTAFTTIDGSLGIVDRTSGTISHTRKHCGDKWDIEKAVAIGLLKLHNVPFSVVLALSKEVEESLKTKKLGRYGKKVLNSNEGVL